MKYGSIFKSLGVILLTLSVSMLAPTLYAVFSSMEELKAFSLALGVTFILGLAMALSPKSRLAMDYRDGFVVVTFGWFFAAACGALPYVFSGSVTSFTDGFFESMSGFTTTGSSIMNNIESLPPSILLWRSMTQWLGGMGIIVLTIAILPYLDLGGMSIFQAEVPGPTAEKLTPRIQDTAKFLWIVYTMLTLVLAFALKFADMSWFDSVNHALATMATGGFSTKNASVASFNSPMIEWILTLFMLLAGVNFALHYQFFFRGFKLKSYFEDTELKFYLFLIGASTAIISIFLFTAGSDTLLEKSIRDSAFTVISVVTTTGFGTADYELWAILPQFILMFLMLVGGSAGSTAGGIKSVRILLVFKYMHVEMLKLIHPNLIKSIKIRNTSVQPKVVAGILSFIFVYTSVLMGSILLVSFDAPDMMTAIGSVVACLSNIGPGFGTVGPTENFAHLSSLTKWILSIDMAMGRLELLTVLVLFLPQTWMK